MEKDMKATITTKSGDVLEPTVARYPSQREICMEHVDRLRHQAMRMEERVPQKVQRFNPNILPFCLMIVILACAAIVV